MNVYSPTQMCFYSQVIESSDRSSTAVDLETIGIICSMLFVLLLCNKINLDILCSTLVYNLYIW
jgi:hypothetical protein